MKKIIIAIICFFVFNFSVYALGGKVENNFGKFDFNSNRINDLYDVSNTNIPKKLDLSDKFEFNVYSQNGDTCQLYSLVACLESNMLLTSDKKMNVSHNYLDYMTSFMFLGSRAYHGTFEVNEGLDLISLKGFVSLNDVSDIIPPISFEDYGFIGDIKPKQVVDEYVVFPGFEDLSEKDIDSWLNIMKLHVMKYGAVSITILANDETLDEVYNSNNASYYNDKIIDFDRLDDVDFHAVSIVGWDDNYSKNNFNKKPKGNGAFKCINSWGSNWGDDGFFYISYYDVYLLNKEKYGIISTKETDFSNIYSTSPSWLRISIDDEGDGYSKPSNAPIENEKIYYLIKFDKSQYKEYLKAISIYLDDYKNVKFYINTSNDNENLKSFKYVGELNIRDIYDGFTTYITLDLEDDIVLDGDSFSLLLEYEQEVFKYTFTDENGNFLKSGKTLKKEKEDSSWQVSYDLPVLIHTKQTDDIIIKKTYNYTLYIIGSIILLFLLVFVILNVFKRRNVEFKR